MLSSWLEIKGKPNNSLCGPIFGFLTEKPIKKENEQT